MKTNYFKKIMCACMLLTTFAFFISAEERDEMPKFCYNNLGAKALEESQIVCVYDKNGKYLKPRVKYLFTYDDNSRMIKKEALRWNAEKNNWVNSYCIKFIYGDDSMVTEYAEWNKREKAYNDSSQKMVYEVNANMIAFYGYYKRNLPDGDWKLEKNSLVSVPAETLWSENGIILAENK